MEDIVGTKKCLMCGTEFEVTNSNRHKKYCSRACNERDRRLRSGKTKIHIKNCIVCGKKFETTVSYSKVCSEECRAEQTKRRARICYENRRTLKPRHKVCIVCGKEFETSAAQAKTCSKECSITNNRINTKKRCAANRKGLQEVKCAVCGKQFLSDGRQIYCTPACRKEAYKDYRPKKMSMPNKCETCGEEFYKTTGGQKYCSPECKKSGRMKKPVIKKPRKKIDKYTPFDYGFVESQKTIIEHNTDMKQAYMEFKRRQLAGVI